MLFSDEFLVFDLFWRTSLALAPTHEIELPNRRICDVHFRLSFSGRPEEPEEARKQKWTKSKVFSHWAFPFFSSSFADTHSRRKKNRYLFLLYFIFPLSLLGWWKSLDQKSTGLWYIYSGVCKWGRDPSNPTKWWGRKQMFFFSFLLRQKKRERLSVCQTSFNCKSEWGYKQNREQKSKKKKNRNVTSSFWLWYSIHFLFCLKSNLIPICLIHRHLFLFFFFNSRFITQFAYASHHFEELENM